MKTHLFAVMTITAVLAMTATTWGAAMGLDTTTADLPPDGKYVSSQQFFEYTIPTVGDVVVENPSLSRPHTGTIARAAVGSDEQEDFGATLSGIEIGMGLGPLEVSGPVVVMTYNKVSTTTGIFVAEIVSANFVGNSPLGPIMVREDVQRPSMGQTSIIDLGGGLYHIDSFFDVFTEVSIDGGQNWIASASSAHMVLIPEPATLGLLAMGGLAVLRKRRKR